MEKSDYKMLMSTDRCSRWLAEHCPRYALPKSMLRALAVQEGSGLRATVLPTRGIIRRKQVLVRPADVVEYLKAKTVA